MTAQKFRSFLKARIGRSIRNTRSGVEEFPNSEKYIASHDKSVNLEIALDELLAANEGNDDLADMIAKVEALFDDIARNAYANAIRYPNSKYHAAAVKQVEKTIIEVKKLVRELPALTDGIEE